jgi:AraC-like DNA-binding protein
MSVEDQVLFLFCGIGSINGAAMALYFMSRRPLVLTNMFLGSALLALSFRVFKSALFYFNPEVSLSLLQAGLTACFLVGPLMFLYASSFRGILEKQPLHWKYHLGGLLVLLAVVNLALPYHRYPALWRSGVYDTIILIWFGYQTLAAAVLFPIWRRAIGQPGALAKGEWWALSVVGGTWLISLAYLTADYTSYLLASTLMSVLLLLGLLCFALFSGERPKYGGRKIAGVDDRAREIKMAIAEAKLHLDPNLTLAGAARRLNQPKAQLSQIINEATGMSFTSFINELRIEEAKRLLSSSPDLPIEEVATRSGFNSQSTLYAAFKKVTALTPGAFRKAARSPSPDFRKGVSGI